VKYLFFFALICGLAISALTSCSSDYAGESQPVAVSISAFYDSAFLTEGVYLFNQLHPDSPVQLNVFGQSSILNEEDRIEMFVNYISTALMSGTADDIIVLANLPFHRFYAMLADMSPFMETSGISNNDRFFTNLFDAVKINGGQYILPLDFNMNLLAFNRLHVDRFNVQNVINFANANAIGLSILENRDTDFTGLYNVDAFSLFIHIFNSTFNQFIDLPGRVSGLDSREFIEILEILQYMEQRRFIPSIDDFMDGFMYGEVILEFTDIMDIELLIGGVEDFTDVAAISDSDGRVFFSSHTVLGINDMSENKETAWEFIQFLLSDEMQGSLNLPAIPVNRNAIRNNAPAVIDQVLQLRNEGGNPIEDDATEIALRLISKIESIAGLAQYLIIYEPMITNILFDVGMDFFMGGQSAEDTAAIMHNRINLYLNE